MNNKYNKLPLKRCNAVFVFFSTDASAGQFVASHKIDAKLSGRPNGPELPPKINATALSNPFIPPFSESFAK